MYRIAPVNLHCRSKALWFDAGDLAIHAGDGVVVDTVRGIEFGHVCAEVFEADETEIAKLKSPLKSVRRVATPEDEAQAEAMQRKSDEALPIFREMVTETKSDMRPISVEYLFDGDKAVFYFEAEDRVDFRELVRKLAAHFHVRIDMRQIGVRDEARMLGGLGHCGQELCCKRLGGEFCPVSIRMAKEQDLSLNPQKISGVCGRLMCCLRYEFEAYKDFKSRAPKLNSQVDTPAGIAKVVDLDVPREIVSLKGEDEKILPIPLADFDSPSEGMRPKVVGNLAWEKASVQAAIGVSRESSVFTTSQFTHSDRLASSAAIHRGESHDESKSFESVVAQHHAPQRASAIKSSLMRKPRRRSTKVKGEMRVTQNSETAKGCTVQKTASKKSQPVDRKKQGSGKKQQFHSNAAVQAKQLCSGNTVKKKQASKKQSAPLAQNAKKNPRPGQKSSALRQQSGACKQDNAISASSAVHIHTENKTGGSHRKQRRRSHKTGGFDTRDSA